MNKSNTHKTGGDPKVDISALRQAIDEIDEKILDLINQRLSLVKQIGDFKKQGGVQILDSGREKEILNRLLEKNDGPMGTDGLRNIFEAIITEGRNVQRTGFSAKGIKQK
jgi:chorismate mutase/prephenate dehydratase